MNQIHRYDGAKPVDDETRMLEDTRREKIERWHMEHPERDDETTLMRQKGTMATGIEATAAALQERGGTHGNWLRQSSMTQGLKGLFRSGANWPTLSWSQRDALEMIAVKVGRILTGNPDHLDHWDDIAGYALLGKTETDLQQAA